MKVVTVLKSGGDFDQEYVKRIYNSIDFNYLSQFEIEFVCLSDMDDVPNKIPLWNHHVNDPYFKGWWAKMEIFRPDILDDDIFYLDLDTVIVKPIEEFLTTLKYVSMPIFLNDFYYPEKLATGMMFIPKHIRRHIWDDWDICPEYWMQNLRGDQNFIAENMKDNYYLWGTFNDMVKDFTCSYKAHIIKKYPQHLSPLKVDATKSSVVCFHGSPRPHEVNWQIN